jgi:hypothetical protein
MNQNWIGEKRIPPNCIERKLRKAISKLKFTLHNGGCGFCSSRRDESVVTIEVQNSECRLCAAGALHRCCNSVLPAVGLCASAQAFTGSGELRRRHFLRLSQKPTSANYADISYEGSCSSGTTFLSRHEVCMMER